MQSQIPNHILVFPRFNIKNLLLGMVLDNIWGALVEISTTVSSFDFWQIKFAVWALRIKLSSHTPPTSPFDDFEEVKEQFPTKSEEFEFPVTISSGQISPINSSVDNGFHESKSFDSIVDYHAFIVTSMN